MRGEVVPGPLFVGVQSGAEHGIEGGARHGFCGNTGHNELVEEMWDRRDRLGVGGVLWLHPHSLNSSPKRVAVSIVMGHVGAW